MGMVSRILLNTLANSTSHVGGTLDVLAGPMDSLDSSWML